MCGERNMDFGRLRTENPSTSRKIRVKAIMSNVFIVKEVILRTAEARATCISMR